MVEKLCLGTYYHVYEISHLMGAGISISIPLQIETEIGCSPRTGSAWIDKIGSVYLYLFRSHLKKITRNVKEELDLPIRLRT